MVLVEMERIKWVLDVLGRSEPTRLANGLDLGM